MSISLDFDTEETRIGSMAPATIVGPNDSMIDNTARKVNETVSVPTYAAVERSSAGLEGRLTPGKATLEELQAFLLEQPNYLNEIREVVAKILAQLNKVSEKDRDEIQRMKKKYEEAYLSSADLTRRMGTNNLVFAGLALIPLALLLSSDELDRKAGEAFATKFIPSVGEMWRSSLEADMKKKDSLNSLLLQDYSQKTQQKTSEGNNKQEYISIFDKALSALKAAAQPN